jgi:RNA polymerase sigma factor (sigma-70 family)
MDDARLLQQYVETGSQDAFGQLVRRHVNLVFSAALRHVRDRHIAEEVTQAVFIVLSRKAATLRHEAVLSSWLMSTTRYAALGHMKIAARRKRHEKRAAEMAKTAWTDQADLRWPEFEGDMDAALASLREVDRRAVMLRFYEQKNFDEIAAILGTAEEAARKRVSRAVEKLRAYFGVGHQTLPTALLTYFLTSKLVSSAPLHICESVMSATTSPLLAPTGAAAISHHVAQKLAIVKAKVMAGTIATAAVICLAVSALVLNMMNHPPVHPTPRTAPRELPVRAAAQTPPHPYSV